MAWALLGDSGEAFTEPREVADTAFFGLSLGGAAAGAAAGEEFNLAGRAQSERLQERWERDDMPISFAMRSISSLVTSFGGS